nr:MAG TPA: hypothetical protein [Caudoviricetes sp.]
MFLHILCTSFAQKWLYLHEKTNRLAFFQRH